MDDTIYYAVSIWVGMLGMCFLVGILSYYLRGGDGPYAQHS